MADDKPPGPWAQAYELLVPFSDFMRTHKAELALHPTVWAEYSDGFIFAAEVGLAGVVALVDDVVMHAAEATDPRYSQRKAP